MEGGTYIHHNLNKLSLLLLDNDGDRAPPVEFLPLHDDVTGVNYSRDETLKKIIFYRENMTINILEGVNVIKTEPRMVRQMLMRRSQPHPRANITPSGGKINARMKRQQSAQVIFD